MDLAIITVSWNVRPLLAGCLTSISQSLADSTREGKVVETHVWVIDNHSSDGTPEMVRERFPNVSFIENKTNQGFAAGNNQGIEQALSCNPRFIMLLNPDTVVRGKALETLIGFLDQTPRVGMAGARLVYGDGSFQHSAFYFPGLAQLAIDLLPVLARLANTGLNGRYPVSNYAATAPPFRTDHLLGAAMVVRSEVIEAVGLLDTGFYMYCEEIDWAMRIQRAGWEIFCVPAAEIVHYGGQSTAQIPAESFVSLWRSRHRLYTKHYSPAKVRAAGRLVRLGMKLKIRQSDSEELTAAYREVAAIWSHHE